MSYLCTVKRMKTHPQTPPVREGRERDEANKIKILRLEDFNLKRKRYESSPAKIMNKEQLVFMS